eukprot:2883187-Rhodomonas_salina.5
MSLPDQGTPQTGRKRTCMRVARATATDLLRLQAVDQEPGCDVAEILLLRSALDRPRLVPGPDRDRVRHQLRNLGDHEQRDRLALSDPAHPVRTLPSHPLFAQSRASHANRVKSSIWPRHNSKSICPRHGQLGLPKTEADRRERARTWAKSRKVMSLPSVSAARAVWNCLMSMPARARRVRTVRCACVMVAAMRRACSTRQSITRPDDDAGCIIIVAALGRSMRGEREREREREKGGTCGVALVVEGEALVQTGSALP